jgi:hypothetical protein
MDHEMIHKFVATAFIAAAALGGVVSPQSFEAPKAAETQKKKAFTALLYKQADARWAYDKMGGGAYMRDKGCVISDIAMALAYKGITVSGATATPGNVNLWLKGHGGYSGNSVIWSTVNRLSSRVVFQGRYYSNTDLSAATLRTYLDAGNKVVIANVRNGGHWVLLTGHNGGTVFNVNDPGYSQVTYNYSDFVGYAVYTIN